MSLVPSITESLRAWDRDPIACTRYCEQPDLLHVGGTKNPDVEAIVELHPDVVLMDKVENRREDATTLEAAGLRVVAVDVQTVDDVAPALAELRRAVGLADEADSPMQWPTPVAGSPSAFIPIWRRPWMTIGPTTYGSTLLALLGIGNVYADATTDYPEVQLRDVALRAPTVVLAPTEPYEFRPEHLDELRAVAPVIEVDGQDLFWWGTRTPTAAGRLRHALTEAFGSLN